MGKGVKCGKSGEIKERVGGEVERSEGGKTMVEAVFRRFYL